MDLQLVTNWLLRLCRLDTTVFEEMRDDPRATVAGIIIAAVSFSIAGLGGWFWWIVEGYGSKTKVFFESVVLGTIFSFALWLAWLGVAYFMLVNLYRHNASFERLVRACSIATVPAALTLFMFLPGINFAIGLAAFALMFLLMDIGIQVAVDAPPGYVIISNFVGFLLFAAVLSVLVERTAYFAPGLFLFRAPANALSDVISASTNALRSLPH